MLSCSLYCSPLQTWLKLRDTWTQQAAWHQKQRHCARGTKTFYLLRPLPLQVQSTNSDGRLQTKNIGSCLDLIISIWSQADSVWSPHCYSTRQVNASWATLKDHLLNLHPLKQQEEPATINDHSLWFTVVCVYLTKQAKKQQMFVNASVSTDWISKQNTPNFLIICSCL